MFNNVNNNVRKPNTDAIEACFIVKILKLAVFVLLFLLLFAATRGSTPEQEAAELLGASNF